MHSDMCPPRRQKETGRRLQPQRWPRGHLPTWPAPRKIGGVSKWSWAADDSDFLPTIGAATSDDGHGNKGSFRKFAKWK